MIIARTSDPELDRLSNILTAFNDPFGNIPWTDEDRIRQMITVDIPNRVEHDKALSRVMTAVLKDDTELFKQFMDNESFRRWMADSIFGITYDRPSAP